MDCFQNNLVQQSGNYVQFVVQIPSSCFSLEQTKESK